MLIKFLWYSGRFFSKFSQIINPPSSTSQDQSVNAPHSFFVFLNVTNGILSSTPNWTVSTQPCSPPPLRYISSMYTMSPWFKGALRCRVHFLGSVCSSLPSEIIKIWILNQNEHENENIVKHIVYLFAWMVYLHSW